MRNFKAVIDSDSKNKEFNFECYENDYPIEIGDAFIFFFGGIADVQICDSEQEKFEINPNNKQYNKDKIDLVYNFWRNCYKIKSTDFDIESIK